MKKIIAFILTASLLSGICCAESLHTVQEVREQYGKIGRVEQIYAEQADTDSLTPGKMTAEAEDSILNYARFMRWLAYVDEPLEITDDFTALAEDGALLLAAADTPAHSLPQPEGFPDDLYESAAAGIGGSNLAAINWMDTDVLTAAVKHFLRDEGEYNRFTLGHRRWLLSPALQHTGFGIANAESGMTYVTMYVHDFSAETVHSWDHIAWPSAGAFPAEYLHEDTAWSIILNDRIYTSEQPELKISVSCEQTGEQFIMDRMAQEDARDAYWIDADGYGIGFALIFRPFSQQEYEQNQTWSVKLENLLRNDGSLASLEYQVNLMALEPVPVRLIELNRTDCTIAAGEQIDLIADVIPAWADNPAVQWHSSDEAIAVVDCSGHVTAVSAGTCIITAQGADNQTAECTVTVQ